ncbi:MAG: AmmeMemoRadiSam system protein B [bacterium]|nr:AmmeMemoRadiSam system protein B [bacterium]MCP5070172.1 AmmeMemoRadiSam system protein B [bacterium]
MHVREPAVAGAFYPASAKALERLVRDFIEAAPRDPSPPPKALIVPHAGYVYSGPVAGSAYSLLTPLRGTIRRVVLLGPAHRVAIHGLAMPAADALRTPLGVVPVDLEAREQLSDLPQVTTNEAAHADEHSLEVQLPFLQVALGSFQLVPLLVGQARDEEVAEVIERLWGGPETLIVVSSDLSHYLPYDQAQQMDAATCQAIEALNPEALGEQTACGRVPVRGLLRAADRCGLVPHTLDLRSSGDTAGPRDEVVGYGAWSFAEAEGISEDRALLEVARRAVEHAARDGDEMPLDPEAFAEALRRPGACFVTLRQSDKQLRGCIGNLEADRPLVLSVASNAHRAALHDPRFPPLREAELPGLEIHVSVLSVREPIPARSLTELVQLLRPGIDGLVLEDGSCHATFLPDVWSDLPEPSRFVGALWKKAGLPEDHWSPKARAWRYTTHGIG